MWCFGGVTVTGSGGPPGPLQRSGGPLRRLCTPGCRYWPVIPGPEQHPGVQSVPGRATAPGPGGGDHAAVTRHDKPLQRVTVPDHQDHPGPPRTTRTTPDHQDHPDRGQRDCGGAAVPRIYDASGLLVTCHRPSHAGTLGATITDTASCVGLTGSRAHASTGALTSAASSAADRDRASPAVVADWHVDGCRPVSAAIPSAAASGSVTSPGSW